MNIFNRKIGYSIIIGALVSTVSLLGISSFAQQTGITLLFSDLSSGLQPGTFPIQFIGGGNNYAGSLILKRPENLTLGKQIDFTGSNISITCKKQIHGYYFNAARGAGLLPLSSQTLMNDGITVTGGLYTTCNNGKTFDIAGILTYTKNSMPIGSVIFGVETYTGTNSYGSYKPGAIKWLSQGGVSAVNGRFFDTMFGIGEISSANNGIGINGLGVTGSVSDLVGIFSDIYIQGHVGIGQSVEADERITLINNLVGTKTLLTSTDEILSSDIINTVARNTAKKCRSNTYDTSDVPDNLGTSKFICIDLKDGTLTINNQNIDKLVNKDVVFLNGDVQLDRSMYKLTSLTNPLSIYIPDGNLIFESDITVQDLQGMDSNGFLTSNGQSITKGVYMVGNFVVNGLILGSISANLYADDIYRSIPFKTFIHGKLVSLNTFTTVSNKREKLLTNLLKDRNPTYTALTTGANDYFKDGKRNASLGDIFSRECADTTITGFQAQTGGMGAYPIMPGAGFSGSTIDAVRSIPCPIGQRFPLTIIEKNLPSSFFLK